MVILSTEDHGESGNEELKGKMAVLSVNRTWDIPWLSLKGDLVSS